MPTLSARVTDDSVARLAADPRCARALAWIERNSGWLTEQQIRLTEIPAPELGESRRAEAVKALLAACELKTSIDPIGNVVGERPGSEKPDNGVILFAAHIDTVFPGGTDIKIRREARRLVGPGISDNGAGIAALVGLAHALHESCVQTEKTIVLAGDVGEEGEGNLRGIRRLVETHGSRLSAVIAVDGPSTDYVTTQGIASQRFEISISGRGGHSWSNFGAPNPITAISRGIVRFSQVRVPIDPRTSYNFGVIEGGSAVNSIPTRASVKVDLRSEDETELRRLQGTLREAMETGLRDELAITDGASDALSLKFRSLGARPAGKLAADSPLLATIREVDRFLGNRSRTERSSTDANFPLSIGIPAVALGGGGAGGGAHSFDEWYDPANRELGLKRLFLIAIALAGAHL